MHFYMANIGDFINSGLISWIFITLFIILALIPIFIGISVISRDKNLASTIIASLTHCEFNVSGIESCQIENLDRIGKILDEENYPKLKDTYSQYVKDSKKLFHDKWAADIRSYMDREHLLTASEYQRLNTESGYPMLAFSLLISAFFLILCLALGGELASRALPYATLPALSGAVFFFLSYNQKAKSRAAMDMAMKRLADTITMRLPVFSDFAGSAVLIDAFMQYDRKMEKSVNTLSSTISNLLDNSMIEAISKSVENTIRETLTPTLQSSFALLNDLSRTINSHQMSGIRELVTEFTEKSTDLMARRMESFFIELDGYLHQLKDTKGELQQALEVMEQYKIQSNQMSEKVVSYIEDLNNYHRQTSDSLAEISHAQELLGQSSRNLSQMQTGSSNSLQALITGLGQQISLFSQHMDELTRSIHEENANCRQYVQVLIDGQKGAIRQYHGLSDTMVKEGDTLNRQATILNQQLEILNDQLESSVQAFNQALVKNVNEVLAEMDTDLSDMTTRLSQVAGEIRDAADQAQQNRMSSNTED